MATVTPFLHESTSTISYVLADPESRQCAVIDPVLDYDPGSSTIDTGSADRIIAYIRDNGLEVQWILETHAHADHLSAAVYLRKILGGRSAIGEHIIEVQKTWKELLNLEDEFSVDGSQFDKLFADGETFRIGAIECRVLYTPGHTRADITYLVEDMAFIGDTLFMPDYGSARADFPGGDAHMLYASIQKLYALPDQTRLFLCHDYLTVRRDKHCWETTVAEQKAGNIRINAQTSEQSFVEFRQAQDRGLPAPRLLFPSVQVNIRGGHPPLPEANGKTYLKIPLRFSF